MEKQEIVEVIGNEVSVADDEEKIVNLSKTYEFEGKKISRLDFSGLENITANHMIKANKVLNTSGNPSIMPENDLYYALVIASYATKIPVEFFKGLHPRDAIKVKNVVGNFFYIEG